MFKEKTKTALLCEYLRFNFELKEYTTRVYTPEQAILVREAAKTVSAECETALNESAPSDEDIYEIFNFPELKAPDITKVPITISGNDMIGYGG